MNLRNKSSAKMVRLVVEDLIYLPKTSGVEEESTDPKISLPWLEEKNGETIKITTAVKLNAFVLDKMGG